MSKVYLSYRREDSATVAGRIYDWLIQHMPKGDVFFDVDMEYGINFVERIRETISQCRAILVVIGPQWFNEHGEPSQYVRMEVEQALDTGIQVIPVLVGDATMPTQEQLPPTLRRLSLLNAAIVRDGRDFHRDMQDLGRSLNLETIQTTGAAAHTAAPATRAAPPKEDALESPGHRRRSAVIAVASAVMVAAILLIVVIGLQHGLLARFGITAPAAHAAGNATSTPTSGILDPTALYTSVVKQQPTQQDTLVAPSNSKWDTGKSELFGSCEFAGGAYHAVVQTSGLAAECLSTSAEYADASVQVTMKIIAGDAGGILLRYDKNHGTRLRFIVYQDAHWDFTVASGTGVSITLAKGESPYLRSGLGSQNVLTVIDYNGAAYLYANGHFLHSISESSPDVPTYGFVGFTAFDYGLPTDVAFTDVRVWTP